MRRSWILSSFRSYLGDAIYHTPTARYNVAVRWYRTLINLGFPGTPEIARLARFIRYGVLSENEASLIYYGRLSKKDFYRYSLMIYWIDDKWMPEESFYYKHVDWSCFVPVEVEDTTLFP